MTIKFYKTNLKLISDHFKNPRPNGGFMTGDFHFSICSERSGRIGEFQVYMSIPYTEDSQENILKKAYEIFNKELEQ